VKLVRVLLGSHLFYPFEGGAEKQGRLLARILHRQGIGVAYVTVRMPGQPSFEVIDGVPVYRVRPLINLKPSRLQILVHFFTLSICLSHFGRGFDVFQSQGAFDVTAPAMIRVARRHGQRTVVRYASSNERERLGSTLGIGPWLASHLPRADWHVTNSAITLEIMTGQYGLSHERCLVIPNMVELSAPGDKVASRQRLRLAENARIITCVSGFHRGKNQMGVIRAWPEARRSCSLAVLVLVGEGSERIPCQREAVRLGVSDSIVFAGYRTDVKEYLYASDAFVFPSVNEGQSNALLEAMAAGLPIAVADTAMNRLVLTPGIEAMGFDPHEVTSIAETMACLLADQELARELGASARFRIEHEHNPDEIARQFVSLYQRGS
jgi:glycosyltransferase involved in cell wall biosynthesis